MPAPKTAPQPFDPATDPLFLRFGKAVATAQQQNFRDAATMFRKLVEDAHDDPTLEARSREYLALCERRLAAQSAEADEDPYLRAVFAKNRGDFETALNLCRQGERHRQDERMAYLAASILALEGEVAEAAELLAFAVHRNARNRVQAVHDSDFAEVLGRAEFAFVHQTA